MIDQRSANLLSDTDITSAAFKTDPFPFYARLRADAPVLRVIIPRPLRQPAYLVTRYDDAQGLFVDPRFAKNPLNARTPEQLKTSPRVPALLNPLTQNLLGLDDPQHARLKTLVHKAFSPRMIEQMRAQIQTTADELLTMGESKDGMDLMRDYASPLPLIMIGRMLGVPVADNHKFHAWTQAFVGLGEAGSRAIFSIPAMLRFMAYLRKLIKERSARPQDDLISALVQAREGGDVMTDDEVLAMVFLLLSAGHETTVNLIASGMLELLRHPDQLERLRADPSLTRPAIEELLRFAGPAETATERYAREDVMLAGTLIPRGSLVLAVIASANRDERFFEHPDMLDISREPNKHLSFGVGVHYCVGAPLARMESQIAIRTLIDRMPNLRLAQPAGITWRSGFVLRGLVSLPVKFH